MQTNTDFSVPDFFFRNEKLLFWISALLSLVFFAAGIYTNQSLYFIVPFGFVFFCIDYAQFPGCIFHNADGLAGFSRILYWKIRNRLAFRADGNIAGCLYCILSGIK